MQRCRAVLEAAAAAEQGPAEAAVAAEMQGYAEEAAAAEMQGYAEEAAAAAISGAQQTNEFLQKCSFFRLQTSGGKESCKSTGFLRYHRPFGPNLLKFLYLCRN